LVDGSNPSRPTTFFSSRFFLIFTAFKFKSSMLARKFYFGA